jgi:tellurite resistance protein
MSGIEVSAIAGLSNERLEALVEVMFLAACADGDFSAVERAHFLSSVQSLTDGRLTQAVLEGLLDQASAALSREGRAPRLAFVKARLHDAGARKVALSLAIQVTAADGIIRTSEQELLMETADALEIDREQAADMVRRLTAK